MCEIQPTIQGCDMPPIRIINPFASALRVPSSKTTKISPDSTQLPPSLRPPSPGDSQVNSSWSRARRTVVWLWRVVAAGRCPECQTARTMARDRRPHVRDACALRMIFPLSGESEERTCKNQLKLPSHVRARLLHRSDVCSETARPSFPEIKHACPYHAAHRNGLK